MAEPPALTIELVWAQSDWPQTPVRGDYSAAYAVPAAPQQQTIYRVARCLSEGTTVDAALARLLTPEAWHAIQHGDKRAAIYGRRMRPGQPLHDGDRVELLGPISADPMVARSRRVDRERQGQAGDKWRRAKVGMGKG